MYKNSVVKFDIKKNLDQRLYHIAGNVYNTKELRERREQGKKKTMRTIMMGIEKSSSRMMKVEARRRSHVRLSRFS